MKTTLHRIIPSCMAALLALCLAYPLRAQTQDQPAPDNSQENTGPAPRRFGGRRMRRERLEERLQQLSQELNLTDEQKQKIRPALRDEFQQMRALRQDTSLSQQDRIAKAQQIRKASRQQINQFLTPDQQAKLQSIREERRKQMEERRGAATGSEGASPDGGWSGDNNPHQP
jgi:Spy/CpxP family protein refolding chaperone